MTIDNMQFANDNRQYAKGKRENILMRVDPLFTLHSQLPVTHCQFHIAHCSLIIAFCLIVVTGCNSVYTSKKAGYYKIDFPERHYIRFEKEGFPYTFEYPQYANIARDKAYFDSTSDNPFWVNIDFPQFRGKIYISYKTIGEKSLYQVKRNGVYSDSLGINSFEKMVNDCYNLSYKNDVKAYSIEDSIINTPNNISGVFFRITGNVATAKQFFLSDTTKHFLRGALYFDATPNEDSLRPINDFLQEDMKHLINTLTWK